MDSSANLRPRKRKQCSSSNPLDCRFTRSKYRMHVHSTPSGRTWPDTPRRMPFDEAQLLLGKPLEKPRNVRRPSPESEASLGLSIKDLRTRARRVFSPTSMVDEEAKKYEVGNEFSEEGCNRVSKLVDECENLDLGIPESNLGLKNSDMESDLGFACSGKEEPGDREDAGSVPMDADTVLGLGSHGQPDKEENMNLNEKTPVMEKKNGENNVESWKDCRESKRNGSISGSRSVLNSSSKRKVFKAPSSFSYRRLLPFLMEMAKDDSSIPKFDVVEIDYPGKVQNLNNVEANLSSALTACYEGKRIHADDHFDPSETLDEGDYRNSRIQLPVNGQDFDEPTKKAQTEENIELSHTEQRNRENGMNGVDAVMEEFVQTTPPDDNTFRKLDNDNVGTSRKLTAAQNGNHVLEKPSIGNNAASNGIYISMKPQPVRKINSISNARLVLNPCSQLKLIKCSSFSYRRLLPFLTDVAKGTTNIDEPPKFHGEDDSHSVAKESVEEHVPVKRTRTDNFLETQDPEDQEPFATPVNDLPNTDTFHDIIPDAPTSFFNSGASLPNESSYTPSSEAIAKPGGMQLSERTSEYEPVISADDSGKELSAEVIKSCHNENNCSAETSCSTIPQESFTREPKSDVSQVSDHEPSEVAKECMVLGLDYHKDKLQLVKSVDLCQSSLEIEELDHQRYQSDSPTKGILKRNPRGCRGLCKCLNCSSFRLHAERSFEFSKNQMLDAEEVAHGLINELAELRSLLEKSKFGEGDLVAVQINQFKLQAKEACKRALRTELLAKNRLSQMNYDLNSHCRIIPLQRPRVTFSRRIEQIAIPKTDLSSRTNLWEQDERAK